MKKNKFNFFTWIIIIFSVWLVISKFSDEAPSNYKKQSYSELLKSINSKEIKSIEFRENEIYATKNNEEKIHTYIGNRILYSDLINDLKHSNSEIKIIQASNKKYFIYDFIVSWLPLILIFGFYFFRFKIGSDSGNNPFSFSKSKARLLESKTKITFSDVAGIDDAKEELSEIVDFLKDPQKYTDIGVKIPKGCLLIGEPGTGKTLLAKAIAGEANVPFYFISGSDFVEMFVGVGASRVRDMFTEAKKHSPCIVFIDEIDAVGRHRGIGIGGGNDEREQTLNQLLVEMDGFEGNEGVIVIAATNRKDVLDKALLRPGRFDRQIKIYLPDIKGREEILKVHTKKVKMAPNIDLKALAKTTPDFSGAELANIINEAGLLAARANRKVITNADLEEAEERVSIGIKHKNRVKREEELKSVAYHESGHAIVALNCINADPIHKATIISRGDAGGYVAQLPETDGNLLNTTKAKLIDNITICMGGRVAEEIIFGKDNITAGAIGDIQAATKYAKNIVATFGMNDEIGPIYCIDNLINKDGYGLEGSSNEKLKTIDDEIKKIIINCKNIAEDILTKNKDKLDILAKSLLMYETLTGEEIKKLLSGQKIRENENINNSSEIINSESLFIKVLTENNNEEN